MNNNELNFDFLKQDVEKKMNEKGLESLYYVLFDENSSQPWAFHLFYKDGKFMVNGRDDRSYVMGRTVEFDNFDEAKEFFISKLEHFVESSRFKLKIGKKPLYASPLWDKVDT